MNKIIGSLFNVDNQNLRELIIKGGGTFLLKIVSVILAYLLTILITTNFGADVFGRFSIALTFSQFIVMVFTIGLPTYIVKLTSDINYFEQYPKSNYIKKSFYLIFYLGLIISILIYFSADFLSTFLFNDEKLKVYFRIISFLILPMMFHELLANFFRGKKDFNKYNLFTLILPYIAFFILFYLISTYFKNTEEITFLSYILGIAFIFLIELTVYVRLNYRSSISFPTNKLVRSALPMMFSTAFLFLINWTDIFMLGFIETSENVGIYNVAYKISSMGFLIIIPVNIVIAPKISELYSSKQMESLKKLIQQSTRLITFLTLPLFGIIIIFRVEILRFFGVEFIAGEMALIIISIGVLLNAMSGNVDQILNMTNSQKTLRNITIICLIANIILNYYLIPIYGINGAAIASLITNILLNGICIIYIKKKLGFITFY